LVRVICAHKKAAIYTVVLKIYEWVTPGFKGIFPQGVSTLPELAQAMINVNRCGFSKKLPVVKDVVEWAHQL
jgi:hypothetical protein